MANPLARGSMTASIISSMSITSITDGGKHGLGIRGTRLYTKLGQYNQSIHILQKHLSPFAI